MRETEPEPSTRWIEKEKMTMKRKRDRDKRVRAICRNSWLPRKVEESLQGLEQLPRGSSSLTVILPSTLLSSSSSPRRWRDGGPLEDVRVRLYTLIR